MGGYGIPLGALAGAWVLGNLIEWRFVLGGPFNWRILLGPWVYLNWKDRH